MAPRRSLVRVTVGIVVVGVGLLAACARAGPAGGPVPTPNVDGDRPGLVAADYTGRFQTWATVLESPDHGPQLCHAVADSLPPQCSGPDITNWDWTAVEAESAQGTTWGEYALTGTWDGTVFTLTEPAADRDAIEPPAYPERSFAAPCAEPEGGWAPVDADRTTDTTLQAATERAMADAGFAGLWVDQFGRGDNDPGQLVLVVRTTGDVAALENELRTVWGGALCVVDADYTEAELLAVQQELQGEPGVVGSGPDTVANRLDVQVFVATVERQADLDARFGPGMVRQEGLLLPLD